MPGVHHNTPERSQYGFAVHFPKTVFEQSSAAAHSKTFFQCILVPITNVSQSRVIFSQCKEIWEMATLAKTRHARGDSHWGNSIE